MHNIKQLLLIGLTISFIINTNNIPSSLLSCMFFYLHYIIYVREEDCTDVIKIGIAYIYLTFLIRIKHIY